jgi:hypothetical protein
MKVAADDLCGTDQWPLPMHLATLWQSITRHGRSDLRSSLKVSLKRLRRPGRHGPLFHSLGKRQNLAHAARTRSRFKFQALKRTHSLVTFNISFSIRASISTASVGCSIAVPRKVRESKLKKIHPSRGYRCNAIGSSVRDFHSGLGLQPIEQRVHLA